MAKAFVGACEAFAHAVAVQAAVQPSFPEHTIMNSAFAKIDPVGIS